MMIRSVVGILVGAVLGLLVFGPMGGALGAFCGLALGLLAGAVVPSSSAVPAGADVHREQHKVVCISKGEVGDCVMLRDTGTGEFLDVESCSLEKQGRPRCLKRCLDLIPKGLRRSKVQTQPPVQETGSASPDYS